MLSMLSFFKVAQCTGVPILAMYLDEVPVGCDSGDARILCIRCEEALIDDAWAAGYSGFADDFENNNAAHVWKPPDLIPN